MSFDRLVDTEIGPLGKWQLLIFVLIAIPSNMPGPLIPQFANLDVAHACSFSWTRNWSYAEVANFSASLYALEEMNSTRDIVCSRVRPRELVENASLSDPRSWLRENVAVSVEKCDSWVYDSANSLYRRSLIQDFDLVCDRRYLIPYSASAFGLGYGLGCVLGGQLGDQWGRKSVISVFYPLTGLLLTLVSVCSHFSLFILLRALSGVTSGVGYTVGYVLFLETTNHRHRNTLSVVDGALYYLVCINVNVVLSYALQDWRWVHVACGLGYSVSLLYPCLLPESPRWLLAKGRHADALKVVQAAVRANRGAAAAAALTLESLAPAMGEESPGKDRCVGADWKEFLCTPALSRKWIPLAWVWVVVLGAFYGVSFYAVRLPWNPYVIAAVLSACALLLKPAQWLLYHRCARKRSLVALIVVAGSLCLFAFLAILFHASTAALVLSVVAYAVVCCIFDMLYLYTPELFPTLHRSKALGLLQAVSYLGMVGGTHVERLDQEVWTPLPMLVFGGALASAALCCALLMSADSGDTASKAEEEECAV